MRISRLSSVGIWLAPLLLIAACGGQQQQTTTTTTQQPTTTERTMVRFVHASPDAGSLDVWVGNTELRPNVGYQEWSDWVEVPATELDVTIRRGEAIELTDTFNFRADQHYWIFLWGTMTTVAGENPLSFIIAPEEGFDAAIEDVWVRFANLVADGEALAYVITTGGSLNMLFPNQGVGSVSEFKLGPVFENSFEFRPSRNTNLEAVLEFDRDLAVGIMYTFVATGRVGNNTLDVFVVTDTPLRE